LLAPARTSSRGLFQRAIVESGTFALTQQSLWADAETIPSLRFWSRLLDHTAQCLLTLPVDTTGIQFLDLAIPPPPGGAP